MRSPLTRCVYLLVLNLLTAGAYAGSATNQELADDQEIYRYQAERIIAVGDVHGAFEPLVAVLRANGLIDEANNWSGGNAHLVSLGDLLDRGPRSRDVLDLLRKLQDQAKLAGGRVHVVLGNHEVLNLLGDLSYVSDAEFAAFAPQSTKPLSTETTLVRPPGYDELLAALGPDGTYGAWLLTLPAMIQINDTVFVHGGLSPALGTRDLVSINAEIAAELRHALNSLQLPKAQRNDEVANLLGDSGPFWYRGTASCHPLLEQPILTRQLRQLGAARVVIGHTPTPTRKPLTRLNEQVFAIDTGMLRQVYRGKPYLLELTANDVRVLDATGKSSTPQWWHPTLQRRPEDEPQLAEMIRSGHSVPGEWTTGGKKTIAKAIARWRLDRALGLWLTPLTVASTDNKRFFEAVRGKWITEGERQEQGIALSNYCVQGQQYQLVSVFDALVGVTTRSAGNLFVHKATGVARIEFVKASFGTRTTLPTYARQPTLPLALAKKLRVLNKTGLTELLGDLLTQRQINAILIRRDKILLWPEAEQQL